MADYAGLLAIGDPHLASRAVGFRSDNYALTGLRKLRWCLAYAREHRLLPVILGDLFHHPRDNANWLLGETLGMFAAQEVVGIYGNHDVRENELREDDSLSVLVCAGHYRLLDLEEPWRGKVAGVDTAVFGISWGRPMPEAIERGPQDVRTVLATHHDVQMPGYEEQGRFSPYEIEGLDLVVNGHIHRRLNERQVGRTLWVNPGNICRVSRSDASRLAVPSVLRLTPTAEGWERECVEVPHDPFEFVFHAAVEEEVPEQESAFVRGLAELQTRRTESGAGLRQFLDLNLSAFEPDIQGEIDALATLVLNDASSPEVHP